MMNNKIAMLALSGIISVCSLYAVAEDMSTVGSTTNDGKSQTREPAPKATNADPDAGSLPKGADGGTTDNGPIPGGAKTGGGGQVGGGSSSGGSAGGGGNGGTK